MNGYTLKQCGSKLWIVVYTVIRNGVIIVSEDKENFLQGNYLKVLSLEKIGICIDNTVDKKLMPVFYVRITSANQQEEVTLGFRFKETRSSWYCAVLTEHAKLFIERTHESETIQKPKSSSSSSPFRSVFSSRISLPSAVREKLNSSFSGVVRKRPRAKSFNFEQLRRRPVSMFAVIFNTKTDVESKRTSSYDI